LEAATKPPPARADLVVVGGGFAGLATAIRLAEAEPAARIMLLEAEFVGFGASGRNAGLISPLPAPIWLATADRTPEHAWALRRMNAATHELAAWLHAVAPASSVTPTKLRLEAGGAITGAGLATVASILNRSGIAHTCATDPRRGRRTIVDIPAHTIDPYATVLALAEHARRLGVTIHEGVRVQAVAETDNGVAVHIVGGAEVAARAAVVCTNAYASSVQLPKAPRAKAVRTFMLATQDLDDATLARLPDGQPFVVEISTAYVYYRRHGRKLIYGGIDKRITPASDDFAVEPIVLSQLERHLHRTLAGGFAEVAEAWSGRYHLTATELPQIEPSGLRGRVILNVGYGGTGVALTMICARMAADLALRGAVEDPDERRLLAALQQTRIPLLGGLRFVAAVVATTLGLSRRHDL
jgi:gamma-glutamylputrescine oxidase